MIEIISFTRGEYHFDGIFIRNSRVICDAEYVLFMVGGIRYVKSC